MNEKRMEKFQTRQKQSIHEDWTSSSIYKFICSNDWDYSCRVSTKYDLLRGEKMKIEGSVQELELFFKKFNLIEKTEIKIDGTKVGEQIVPSVKKIFKNTKPNDF